MPQHPEDFAKGLSVGIIMDGNGRWAKKRGLPRTARPQKGAEVFQQIADYCDQLGLASVYFYAFSTENWKRPAEEVGAIMKLLGEYLVRAFDYKSRNNKIVFLGDRTALEPRYQQLMNEIEEGNRRPHRHGAECGGELRRPPGDRPGGPGLARQAAAGQLDPAAIDEQMLAAHLYTAGQRTRT